MFISPVITDPSVAINMPFASIVKFSAVALSLRFNVPFWLTVVFVAVAPDSRFNVPFSLMVELLKVPSFTNTLAPVIFDEDASTASLKCTAPFSEL